MTQKIKNILDEIKLDEIELKLYGDLNLQNVNVFVLDPKIGQYIYRRLIVETTEGIVVTAIPVPPIGNMHFPPDTIDDVVKKMAGFQAEGGNVYAKGIEEQRSLVGRARYTGDRKDITFDDLILLVGAQYLQQKKNYLEQHQQQNRWIQNMPRV